MPSPEEMARRAARAVHEDVPVWVGCGYGHASTLIGRNEKSVQLVHESLSKQIGYKGLTYR